MWTRAPKIAEIAKLAGVGTATVDRVLNGRAHVRPEMRQRVMQAKETLETGGPQVARKKPWRIKVFLPEGAGPATEFLARCFLESGRVSNALVECVYSRKFEPATLARKLRAAAGQGLDAVAFQPLEDPRVHDAISELKGYGIPSAAIMSGFENTSIVGFVGIDNRSAGRTAGYLMGRLLPRAGRVAILSGGELYRVHEDREIGFRTVIRSQYPFLDVICTHGGRDDVEGNYREMCLLLEQYPDLCGVYNIGGGNRGVVRALNEAGVASEMVYIGHNLSRYTRNFLLDGSMDVIIHQNCRLVAEETIRLLVAHLEKEEFRQTMVPVEVITRENVTGAVFA